MHAKPSHQFASVQQKILKAQAFPKKNLILKISICRAITSSSSFCVYLQNSDNKPPPSCSASYKIPHLIIKWITLSSIHSLVWFGEAMNKVKWVWSFWLCFPGDYLTCESDKALDLCQTVKTYKAGTTQLSQFHVGVPKMDLCDFRNSWKVSGKEIGPLRISSFRHWQPTNFLQQNQVFPADVVCGSREKWLWGSCHKSRTSWDHSGVSVGLRGKTVGPRAGQEESLRALSTWLWPWTW